MSDWERRWHDALSDLLGEETKDQLARARQRLAKKREERQRLDASENEKWLAEQDLQREALERELSHAAVKELEKKYEGLGYLPSAFVMAMASLTSAGGSLFQPHLMAPLLFAAVGFGLGSAGFFSGYLAAKKKIARLGPSSRSSSTPSESFSSTSSEKPWEHSAGTFSSTRSRSDGTSARPAEVVRPAASPRSEPVKSPSTDEAADPLQERIEEACRQLQAALGEAPAEVRTLLGAYPKQTLDELAASSRSFQQRERKLRASSTPELRARVQAEDDNLQSKLDRATDAAVRASLGAARAALFRHQAHLEELQRSADRLEAERVRLGHTLEGLLAQVLRIKYAQGLSPGQVPVNLREGLERLQAELSALAEASEEVGRIEDLGSSLQDPYGEGDAERAGRHGRRGGRSRDRT